MKVRLNDTMTKKSSSEQLVQYKGFLLEREHLDRLLAIQKRRRELDPHMKKPAIGKGTR